ncbi:MAG: DUF4185 domain-containing protein [Candidatus Neomarinimicrobiota bacterium]
MNVERWKNATLVQSLVCFLALLMISGCRFDLIDQPDSAQPGATIDITVKISDSIDETNNPHKGILCVLLPIDWNIISATYSGDIGSGIMEPSDQWADTAEFHYPAARYTGNMHWVGLISDSGYTYSGNPSVTIALNVQVGTTQGCFDLAYLATKATGGIMGWSPLAYPNRIGVPTSCQPVPEYKVSTADDWSDLFDRSSGWTGSDAVYSIPLSGYDRADDPDYRGTLFLFGDTFIGDVDENDKRLNPRLIRNTAALVRSRTADPDSTDFIWRTEPDGDPVHVFAADTPESQPGDWIWPMDGIAIGGITYVYGLRLSEDKTTGWGFQLAGVTLISFLTDSLPAISNPEQVDLPFFDIDTVAGYQAVIGQAVLDMTAGSGNPGADGYIYVYGPRSYSAQKKMIVARVLPEHIREPQQYRFWDGCEWTADIKASAELAGSISQEFSVTPLDDGRFIIVFNYGTSVGINFGESPVGPFGFPQNIYACPEIELNSNIFVYNAKAHPHLSLPGTLLISYNVNTFSLSDLLNQADIYRPRFITLHLDSATVGITAETPDVLPQLVDLGQNYPNPFNPSTSINYHLSRDAQVSLVIVDLRGREICTLIDCRQSAGNLQVQWDGCDSRGIPVAAGVYLYRISATALSTGLTQQSTRKMILIK